MLVQRGYERVTQVLSRGQFSLRETYLMFTQYLQSRHTGIEFLTT